jgi:hypothetical protein
LQAGVDDRGTGSLVFPELGKKIGGYGDRDLRGFSMENSCGGLFMFRVGVGV